MYNGGSDEDELLIHINGLDNTTSVKSFGNQMFIKFKTLGAGIDKGFTLNISFGSRTKVLYLLRKVDASQDFLTC